MQQTLHSISSYRMLLRGEKNTKSRLFLEKANSLEKKLDKKPTHLLWREILKKSFIWEQYLPYGWGKIIGPYSSARCSTAEWAVVKAGLWDSGGRKLLLQESVPPRALLDLSSLLFCLSCTSVLTSECLFAKMQSSHSRHSMPQPIQTVFLLHSNASFREL